MLTICTGSRRNDLKTREEEGRTKKNSECEENREGTERIKFGVKSLQHEVGGELGDFNETKQIYIISNPFLI